MSFVIAAVTGTVPGSVIKAWPALQPTHRHMIGLNVFAFVPTMLMATIPGKGLPAGTCWRERLCTGSAACMYLMSRWQILALRFHREGLHRKGRWEWPWGPSKHAVHQTH